MVRPLTALLLFLFFTPLPVRAVDRAADVEVRARIERVDATHAELIVSAEIADGLHIYAQSQPKPFLATRISVEANAGVSALGEFQPDRDPLTLRHEKLGVELHEFEGAVEWRSLVTLEAPSAPLNVTGDVFAQACQADRCFAPQTYTFTASLDAQSSLPLASAAETSGATDEPEFELAQLQIVTESSRSAWSVLPLAFVAGFLLNFMPCVLPVVGLKLLSFVQQAQSDRRRILLMNLAYTAGLLSVMWVLATLAAFAGLGWGEQFSSAAFTVSLSAIVFAFGLSFLGVWEIPLPGFVGQAGGTAKEEGYGGAFSKGILSTLLATPCSGPFLGAALAWAVTQPTYLTYSVFTSVGLGMASPYLVVGLFPSMIRFLPKPGEWMITFKQLMGFIMLATVVYLMSFMPIASVVPTVLLLLGIGLALWYAGRTPVYAPASERLRAWAVAGAIVVGVALTSFGWLEDVMQARFQRAAERLLADQSIEVASETDAGLIAWQNYSPELLEASVREGRTVFVDFTADWCLTCKSNEASAIETEAFADALRTGNAIALRADKTEPNPEVDELLRRLGNSAASIPFYAVFPADHPEEPVLLDGIFSSPEPLVRAISSVYPRETPASPATTDLAGMKFSVAK